MNHSSGKATNSGYSDFTSFSATVLQGSTPTLSVGRTSVSFTSSVSAWIDFNQNGVFEISERILAENASTIKSGTASSTFTVPSNASIGSTRMRIIATTYSTASNYGCSSYQTYAETEDYTVIILPTSQPPLADFIVPNQTSCSGTINFIDKSVAAPTSWSWNFGDPASGTSNTSSLQNPSHTFSSPGSYTIRLTTCNANGCNTIVKQNYVSYPSNLTVTPASCSPQTLNVCCNKGIQNVSFNNGVINNTTGNSAEGYQDYSCTQNAIVNYNQLQTLRIQTFNDNDQVLACIDFDNDGIFGAGETILYPSTGTKTVSFNFPANVVRNVYLRMRIMSEDAAYTIQGPCSNVQKGQVEDYAIKVVEPPISAFSDSSFSTCSGVINFTDNSSGVPTNWLWNFGDPTSGTANTSTAQNPTHTFAASGHYLVSLEVCNSTGCNTITKNIYVGLNPNITIPLSCIPTKNDTTSGYEIKGVNFVGINNFTPFSITSYGNYSCSHQTNLVNGKIYPIQITTDRTSTSTVQVWIDYDNDGIFNIWERVFLSNTIGNHTGNVHIQPTGSLAKNTYVRMRIQSTVMFQPPIAPCGYIPRGETEDYAVMIVDPTGVSENNFANAISIYPNPNNGTFHLEMPTVFNGDLQLEVHNLIGQKIAEQQIKQTGNISQVNLGHLPKGIYMLRVYNEEVSAVKKIVIE